MKGKYDDLFLFWLPGFLCGLLVGLAVALCVWTHWEDKTRWTRSDVQTFKDTWLDCERQLIQHDLEFVTKPKPKGGKP